MWHFVNIISFKYCKSKDSIMKQQENISRRDALKRMAKTAMAVAVASMFPSEDALANNADLNIQYTDYKYVDRCYSDYYNYHNYQNYRDYQNYGDYKDYSNYHDYSNAPSK